jgi:outer membrane protein assembly factor BamA
MRRWIVPVLVAVASSPCSVSAQTSQSNKASYEGQPVATVELVANPKISIEPLRGLVRQLAGEAYSDAQVQETVSALQGSGNRRVWVCE